MKKIIVTTAVIVFSMAIIAYAAPDSNSIVKDDIEYYMQTDKSVYNLGEEEEEEGGTTSEQDGLVLIELKTDNGELGYELKPRISKIAFSSNRDGNYEIYVMNADGSEQTRLTYNDADDRHPSWSPDEKKIAFSSNRDGNFEIYVMNADGSEQTRLTYEGRDEWAPAWQYNGDNILYYDPYWDGTIYMMNANGSSQTALVTGWDPSWSSDGTKITYSSNEHVGYPQIYIMNPDGGNQTRLIFSNLIDREPVWSPDGTKMVFTRREPSPAPENPPISKIYVMDIDGNSQTNLSDGQNPSWSPDGKKIAFSSNRDGNYEIYVMNADGSEQTRLTFTGSQNFEPAWSPYLEPENINCKIVDEIEYCMQTDKHTYHLGEDVEMLYRVTNLGGEDVILGWVVFDPLNYYTFKVIMQNDGQVWEYHHPTAVAAFGSFHLDPYESKEFQTIWNMMNDNGTPWLPYDDFPVGPNLYDVIGELDLISGERVPVSVPIEIIPPPAITYYVNATEGSDDNDGLSSQTPFATIQKAIDSAFDGDTIIVQPGLYMGVATYPGSRRGNINFLGKNIILTSTNPVNPDTVLATSIGGEDGNEASVIFRGTEDESCALIGFNINGNIIGFDWSIDPTGENHTHAEISYCLLQGNCGACGSIIWACDGIISNCAIVDNSSHMCMIPEKNPTIGWCSGLFKNCTLANGSDVFGSRVWISVRDGETLTIRNCILYNALVTLDYGATLNISYCNVQGGLSAIYGDGVVNWGPGNIDTDPCFVRLGHWEPGESGWFLVEGDYHLLPGSPCIDAGDPCYIAEPDETDLDGNPRVIGGRIDMGAYEVTPLDLLIELSDNIDAMSLPKGIANSLLAKLNAALQKLEDDNENNDTAAINSLEAFIKTVEAQYGKKIPKANADALIEAAREIIELLNDE